MIVCRKECFHSQESDTMILSEYIFHLLRRGGRSHFVRLRLHTCSKIFECGFGKFSNLRIRLLFTLRLPSIQRKSTNVFLDMTTQTPATAEIEKMTPDPVRFFHKFLTPGPDPKDKRRVLPESTPALRIHDHLCF